MDQQCILHVCPPSWFIMRYLLLDHRICDEFYSIEKVSLKWQELVDASTQSYLREIFQNAATLHVHVILFVEVYRAFRRHRPKILPIWAGTWLRPDLDLALANAQQYIPMGWERLLHSIIMVFGQWFLVYLGLHFCGWQLSKKSKIFPVYIGRINGCFFHDIDYLDFLQWLFSKLSELQWWFLDSIQY